MFAKNFGTALRGIFSFRVDYCRVPRPMINLATSEKLEMRVTRLATGTTRDTRVPTPHEERIKGKGSEKSRKNTGSPCPFVDSKHGATTKRAACPELGANQQFVSVLVAYGLFGLEEEQRNEQYGNLWFLLMGQPVMLSDHGLGIPSRNSSCCAQKTTSYISLHTTERNSWHYRKVVNTFMNPPRVRTHM